MCNKQNAFELLQKANNYEERLKTENTTVKSKEVCQPIPPPPILEHRGNALMVFRPAPFKPSCGTTVSSYSLFLRNAAGNNVKVRLSDTQYKGTGEQVCCCCNYCSCFCLLLSSYFVIIVVVVFCYCCCCCLNSRFFFQKPGTFIYH